MEPTLASRMKHPLIAELLEAATIEGAENGYGEGVIITASEYSRLVDAVMKIRLTLWREGA